MTARWLKPAAAAVLGLVVGAGTALALQRLPEPTPPRATATATGSATGLAPPGTPGPRPPAPGPPVGERSRAGNEVPGLVHSPLAPADRVLLVWTPGRLPDGLAGRAGRIRGVRAVTWSRAGWSG
ncbi:MAG TPA: hypothetical protein VFQ49_09995 [Actinomycetes bacterium]|nr:hypothetical protein [Actinomycetes bacterium]